MRIQFQKQVVDVFQQESEAEPERAVEKVDVAKYVEPAIAVVPQSLTGRAEEDEAGEEFNEPDGEHPDESADRPGKMANQLVEPLDADGDAESVDGEHPEARLAAEFRVNLARFSKPLLHADHADDRIQDGVVQLCEERREQYLNAYAEKAVDESVYEEEHRHLFVKDQEIVGKTEGIVNPV